MPLNNPTFTFEILMKDLSDENTYLSYSLVEIFH